MIIRVFRAKVIEGKQDEFRSFFTEIAIPLIKQQTGMIDVVVGLPLDDDLQEFMMTSYWSDIESLKNFAGEDWKQAVVDDREKYLIEEVSIDHFLKYDAV